MVQKQAHPDSFNNDNRSHEHVLYKEVSFFSKKI